MRSLIHLGIAVAALAAGITTGRVTASLDAPTPVPLGAALAVALLAICVLDNLVGTLLAHRAARRG